jgi:putative flippase GtrA
MAGTAMLDIREFARFVVAGIAATVANLAALWGALFLVSYKVALLAGIAAGLMTSFLLSKLFAFGSASWRRAGGEGMRFLLVYAVGCVVYWGVSVIGRSLLMSYQAPHTIAELGGALTGAGTMLLTSYFGHRFITYGTYRNPRLRSDPAS